MREATTQYLPRQYSENAPAGKNGTVEDPYYQRLSISFLYNAYKYSIQSLRGKIFSTPVEILDDSGEYLKSLGNEIDIDGNNINAFATQLFVNAMHYGLMYVLVDFPPAQSDRMITLADNRAQGARPFFISLAPPDVIGWKTEKIAGRSELVQFRYREIVTADDGEFGDTEVEQIRVFYRERSQIWRKNDNDDYYLHEEMPNTLGKIPVVTYYTQQMGAYQAISPLYDLAMKNLEHWQEGSMQKLASNAARSLILFGSGFPGSVTSPDGSERDSAPLQIGMHQMITAESPDARLEYLEFPISALEYGEEKLKTLKDEMAVLSLGPILQQRPGTMTATEKAIDTAQAQSVLWGWAVDLQAALTDALAIAAEWAQVPAEPEIYINTDFGIPMEMGPELDILHKLAVTNNLSAEWLGMELKRRGVLMDAYDFTVDKERIQSETDQLGVMGREA